PQKKQVLVKYSRDNFTNHFPGQMSFQKSDFSLEILNTTRWDGQLYEYSVSKGAVEEVQQVQLKVYEPVSTPTIQILSMELANGSCSITLNCTAEQGDDVSYSWDSLASRTSGLCSGNSSSLHLSYPLRNSSTISCICKATNPVSSRTVTFNPNHCSHQPGSVGLRMELLLLLVVPVVMVVAMVLV
ncbi:SLAF1 protein, partial [Sakesphorus luctuosus]|nr:SLAF1 protein [Sakesphorus luctuosus]